MMNIFDIETGPVPESELARVKPEFVANRSYKDPAKIAADLAEKEAAWRENAALSAVTGRVLAIGMMDAFGHITIAHDPADEAGVIRRFWLEITNTSPPYRSSSWAGFGIFHFDLPFLIRRSWKLGLRIPPIRNGRYWSEKFVDLREVWQCGDRECGGSLLSVGRFLDLPEQKTGSGADFARLYLDETTRPEAIRYLEQDLKATKALANRLYQ